MNAQKLTQKSLEALQEAQSIASRNSNQAVDQQHLMLALLSQENGLVPQLFVKMDIAPENIEAALTRAVDDIPKVQVGGRAQDSVYISSELDKAFAEAESEASRMKDEYVSVEHLVMYHGQPKQCFEGNIQDLWGNKNKVSESSSSCKGQRSGNEPEPGGNL